MEFKGTKGKWLMTHPKGSNGFLYVGLRPNEGNIATCYTVDADSARFRNVTIETKANALLISKAPEMLEMLKEVKSRLKGNGFPSLTAKIEQLIKEATEI